MLHVAAEGTIISMLEAACGRPPDFICGKPNETVFDIISDKHGLDPKNTLMIGDRSESRRGGNNIIYHSSVRYGWWQRLSQNYVLIVGRGLNLQEVRGSRPDNFFRILHTVCYILSVICHIFPEKMHGCHILA